MTTASSSSSPVSNSGTLELRGEIKWVVGGGSNHWLDLSVDLSEVDNLLTSTQDRENERDDDSITPESPFLCAPPTTTQGEACRSPGRLPPPSQEVRKPRVTLHGLTNLALSGRCPFSGGFGARCSSESGGRGGGGVMGEDRGSVSTLSSLREEATEDSLYSSFEGSEISDQELENERRQRKEGQGEGEREGEEEKQLGQGREERCRHWRERRRKGETVQPRLLMAVGGRIRVGVGPGGESEVGGGGGGGGGGQSDGAEDTPESVPVRKISDCSSRSVDSGTKMSEVSKDDEECQRKLSDLSEASQHDSEEEEPAEGQRREKTTNPRPPSLQKNILRRSGSVHKKIDFFNKWVTTHAQHYQSAEEADTARRKRGRLVRAQSEVVFSVSSLEQTPRRGSLFATQWQETQPT